MAQYRFLRSTRKNKAGEIVEMEKGFWCCYWLEKRVIEPVVREKEPKKKKEKKKNEHILESD